MPLLSTHRSSVLSAALPFTNAAPLLATNSRPLPEGGPASAWWNPKQDLTTSWHMLTSSWLNLMLLAIPFAFVSEYMHWNATTVFLLVRHNCRSA